MIEFILVAIIWYLIGLSASFYGKSILNKKYPNIKNDAFDYFFYFAIAILGPMNWICVLIAVSI